VEVQTNPFAAPHNTLVNNNENTSGKQPPELAVGARLAGKPLSPIVKSRQRVECDAIWRAKRTSRRPAGTLVRHPT